MSYFSWICGIVYTDSLYTCSCM